MELDKTRHILFSLNALDEIQDRFGEFDQLTRELDSMKNLRWLLTLLLNEGAAEDEEPLEEMRVGKMIHTGNLVECKNAIYAAFAIGTAGDEEPEEPDADADADDPDADAGDDGKNTRGGKGK